MSNSARCCRVPFSFRNAGDTTYENGAYEPSGGFDNVETLTRRRCFHDPFGHAVVGRVHRDCIVFPVDFLKQQHEMGDLVPVCQLTRTETADELDKVASSDVNVPRDDCQ